MNYFIHHHPQLSDIDIQPDDVFELLHESDRSPDNPVVQETIYIFNQLSKIVDIHGGYTVYDGLEIHPLQGTIILNNLTLKPEKKICNSIRKSRKIAVFLCTAGPGFTRLTEKYNREGDYLKAYIVDTFGSIVVEKAIDYIQARMEESMNSIGLQISNRYSPGYCNWDIREQKQLFSLIPENKCNISLSESCLMQPIKSVSGIIGIGENVKKMNYACDICNYPTCIYRKTKRTN